MSIDEMEKYRDKDRQEEAGTCIMGEMRKDREGGLPNDVDGLIDHYRHEVRKGQEAYDQLLKELNMLRGTKQIVERLSGENQKMKKRAQEAEGELSILKGIETNRVKEAQGRSSRLQDELDRLKKENNDLYIKIADLTEVAKSKDYFRDPDYKFLVEENHRLEEERNELLADNKKLAAQVEDKMDQLRKSGM